MVESKQINAPCDACGLGPYEIEYIPVCKTNTTWIAENRSDHLCLDCFVSYVLEHTTLSEQEAMVYVYKYSGHSHKAIASLLDVSDSHVGAVIGRIKEKYRTAEQTQILTPIRSNETKTTE